MTTSCDITIQQLVSNSLTLADAFVIGLFVASVVWVISAYMVFGEVLSDE